VPARAIRILAVGMLISVDNLIKHRDRNYG
jgi:hypothetical protein